MVAQEVPGEQQEILEIEPAVLPPPPGVLDGGGRDGAHEDRVEVHAPAGEAGVDRVAAERLELGAQPAGFLAPALGAFERLQDAREGHRVRRVAQGGDPAGAPHGFLEVGPASRRHLGREVGGGAAEELLDGGALGRKVGRRLLRPDLGLDVLVVRERLVRLAQVVEADAELRQAGKDRALHREQALGVAVPGLEPRGAVLGLVHLGEPGIHAGLDRPLAQETRAEGVDRPDEGRVEARERGLEPRAARRRRLRGRPPRGSSGTARRARRRRGS